jgi:predicted nucleic acid-binding protein
MRNGLADGLARRILDTNILVYEHDGRNAAKQQRAHEVIQRAGETYGTGVTSQILAEFASTTVRSPTPILSPSQASLHVERLGREFVVLHVTAACVVEALRGVVAHQLSFWDALIWATARLNQVAVIFTEDMPGGRTIIEGVRYVNPLDPGFELARIGVDV